MNSATEAIRVTPDQRDRIRRMAEEHGLDAMHQVVEILLTGEEKRAKKQAQYRMRIIKELA
jgi:hypothetical protein